MRTLFTCEHNAVMSLGHKQMIVISRRKTSMIAHSLCNHLMSANFQCLYSTHIRSVVAAQAPISRPIQLHRSATRAFGDRRADATPGSANSDKFHSGICLHGHYTS